MAAADPFDTQPDSTENAPLGNCLYGILGAGGGMAAVCSKKWRQRELVEADGQDEQFSKKPRRIVPMVDCGPLLVHVAPLVSCQL